MMRDLDIANLRSFLAVAEFKTVTQAALCRHLTQSAVSQQIRRLEDQLGVRLFDRVGRSVTLSVAGAGFLPYAQRLVEANDESVAFVQGTPFEKTISLGVPHDLVASLLPRPLEAFGKAHPNVRVTLVSGASRDLIQKLTDGQLDIALTTDKRLQSGATLLREDPLVWVGKAGGQAFRNRPLSVALGPVACPFREEAAKALDEAGVPWRPITQVGSLEPVFATILSDMAISPFLKGTIPAGAEQVQDGLPDLPPFSIHLWMRRTDPAPQGLAEQIADCLGGDPAQG